MTMKQMRDVTACLVGGCLVYVAMAACSSGAPSHSPGSTASTAIAGQGGSPGSIREGQGGAPLTSRPGSTVASTPGGSLTNPVPTAAAEPLSGTRLKAKFHVGDDGAKEYLAGFWYDSERKEECSFTTAGDGAVRCLPPGQPFGYFSDSTCKTAVAAVSSTCAAPAYAAKATPSTCGGAAGIQIYTIGAAVTLTALYGQSGSSCYNVGTLPTGFTFYSVGAEVPATSFVAATAGHD